MLMRICMLFAIFAVAIIALAADTPTPGQRARVEAILATINVENPASELAAEDVLVKEGAQLLPAMREMLPVRRLRLQRVNEPCKCLNHWENEGDAAKLASEITALDQAIFRVTNKVNPRQAITTWAHALKFDDGRAFTREFLPLPVLDIETDRLQRIFPNMRFYTAYLPGYQGGAAPPDELLKSFQVPAPLVQAMNLFAVSNTGKLALISQADQGLKTFLQVALPPVKTDIAAKDAAYAWLRLTTAFWVWNNQPLAFLPIADDAMTVKHGAAWPLLVDGTVKVAPLNENKGQISVQMAFDAAGKLVTATETPEIELGLYPLPPMSAPPGGGPGCGPGVCNVLPPAE